MNEADRSAMLLTTSPALKAPDKATLCSITEHSGQVFINCAGFKRSFPTIGAAAKYLDMPWEQLDQMLENERDVLILLRRDHIDPWRSARTIKGEK
jgi:hypothetical protein